MVITTVDDGSVTAPAADAYAVQNRAVIAELCMEQLSGVNQKSWPMREIQHLHRPPSRPLFRTLCHFPRWVLGCVIITVIPHAPALCCPYLVSLPHADGGGIFPATERWTMHTVDILQIESCRISISCYRNICTQTGTLYVMSIIT